MFYDHVGELQKLEEPFITWVILELEVTYMVLRELSTDSKKMSYQTEQNVRSERYFDYPR